MSKTDYLAMTRQQLLELGFRLWSKETGLMLIPGSLFREVLASLPEGTVLTPICGKPGVIGKDMFDDDTRGGLAAWGWIPEKEVTPGRSWRWPGGEL